MSVPIKKSIHGIEDDLDQLQKAYIDEDDDIEQIKIESKFSRLLDEATEIDGQLRNAIGVTINNWVRETKP